MILSFDSVQAHHSSGLVNTRLRVTRTPLASPQTRLPRRRKHLDALTRGEWGNHDPLVGRDNLESST